MDKDLEKPLHPRNKHRGRYNFRALVDSFPTLQTFILLNRFKEESIDFSDPKAVKALNRAILLHFYGVLWDIPEGYLCPPIPGRADYIHYIADFLGDYSKGNIPTGSSLRVLDIGVGANCIYPLIGNKEYGWSFVGVDIDEGALASAKKIVQLNHMEEVISFRTQTNAVNIFKGVIREEDHFDMVICNPPFHSSFEEAKKGTQRKWKNLGIKTNVLNFGGKSSELWCPGGEVSFIRRMIEESSLFKNKCRFFSALVAKADHLPAIYAGLENVGGSLVTTIEMAQGQKKSRIIVWAFS